MPPKYQLSKRQIEDLEKWVATGAEDPRDEASLRTAKVASDEIKRKQHWAYQSPIKTLPTQVRNSAWSANPLDRFILAGLESKGIKPVAEATKGALVRRVYFDLTGLPPSIEQVREFVEDERPLAFAELVTRLLNSPQFGERWGRHWLDVARFGESVTLRGFVFKEAWRYRDYVIHAFNSDLPYDQFVREQIAGDLIADEGSIEERQLKSVAPTFLLLGNTNLEEQDKQQLDMDVVDEQLDTLGKVFLGQTLGCARCHDHKFDPILSTDYYAMAGILRGSQPLEHANVSQWIEKQLPISLEEDAEFKIHEAKLTALQTKITELKSLLAKTGTTSPMPVPVASLPGVVVDDAQAVRVGVWTHSIHSNNFVGDGYLHDGNEGKGSKTLTFHADALTAGVFEVRLAFVANPNRTTRLKVMILHADGESIVQVNQQQNPSIDGRFVSLGSFRFEANGQGYVMISNEGTEGYAVADAVQFLPRDQKPILAVTVQKPDPKKTSSPEAETELKRLETTLKKLSEEIPKRPMVMGLKERPDSADLRVHIRGSVHTLGEIAPRGFLQVAHQGPQPKIAQKQSGRRELANWLASSTNPLTARVMVNRVYGWLLGAGLVRTVDNFGTTGEPPTHPELLDYLTVRFVEEGWSVKKLVFEIMTSNTYRLAAEPPDPRDPANRLHSRANSRRLEAECIRDSILTISGQLESTMGGSIIRTGTTSDFGYQHVESRRSVYLPVFRNSLPELLEAFDFPDPSMVVGLRNVSSIAQQSLFLINHPWMREQSRFAAKRLSAEPITSDLDRVERIYRMALGRSPTVSETTIALNYIKTHLNGNNSDSTKIEAWTDLWQAIFASVDFRYLN